MNKGSVPGQFQSNRNQSERGAATIEYALKCLLIILAALGAVHNLGVTTHQLFNHYAYTINNATSGGGQEFVQFAPPSGPGLGAGVNDSFGIGDTGRPGDSRPSNGDSSSPSALGGGTEGIGEIDEQTAPGDLGGEENASRGDSDDSGSSNSNANDDDRDEADNSPDEGSPMGPHSNG